MSDVSSRVTELVEKVACFPLEHERLLLSPQKYITEPYPESTLPCQYHRILFFLKYVLILFLIYE